MKKPPRHCFTERSGRAEKRVSVVQIAVESSMWRLDHGERHLIELA